MFRGVSGFGKSSGLRFVAGQSSMAVKAQPRPLLAFVILASLLLAPLITLDGQLHDMLIR